MRVTLYFLWRHSSAVVTPYTYTLKLYGYRSGDRSYSSGQCDSTWNRPGVVTLPRVLCLHSFRILTDLDDSLDPLCRRIMHGGVERFV